jgi:hypothetical protein
MLVRNKCVCVYPKLVMDSIMGRLDASMEHGVVLSSATASIELVQPPRDSADAPAPNMDMVLVPFGACSLPAHSGTTPTPRHDAAEAFALSDTEMALASSALTEAMAASVDLKLLQPHPSLMSGDDPACATRLDVTGKPDPLRFTEGMGGVDMFATTKLTCKRMLC